MGPMAPGPRPLHIHVLRALYHVPTAWYSRLKARRKDIAWLKYL